MAVVSVEPLAPAAALMSSSGAMIELPLYFLGGLLGSAHCVGMCGGFALIVGMGARKATASVMRRSFIEELLSFLSGTMRVRSGEPTPGSRRVGLPSINDLGAD